MRYLLTLDKPIAIGNGKRPRNMFLTDFEFAGPILAEDGNTLFEQTIHVTPVDNEERCFPLFGHTIRVSIPWDSVIGVIDQEPC